MNKTRNPATCSVCGRYDMLRILCFGPGYWWVSCDKCGNTGPDAESSREAKVLWIQSQSKPERKSMKARPAMPEQNQCCGTCRWFAYSPDMKTKLGRWKPDVGGGCRYPEAEIVKLLPDSVSQSYGFTAKPMRWMSRKEGTDCPCWQERKDGE